MFGTVMELCRTAINFCVSWFSHLSNVIGFLSVFLGFFIMYQVVRFLLIPLVGQSEASSDRYKKNMERQRKSLKKI